MGCAASQTHSSIVQRRDADANNKKRSPSKSDWSKPSPSSRPRKFVSRCTRTDDDAHRQPIVPPAKQREAFRHCTPRPLGVSPSSTVGGGNAINPRYFSPMATDPANKLPFQPIAPEAPSAEQTEAFSRALTNLGSADETIVLNSSSSALESHSSPVHETTEPRHDLMPLSFNTSKNPSSFSSTIESLSGKGSSSSGSSTKPPRKDAFVSFSSDSQ